MQPKVSITRKLLLFPPFNQIGFIETIISLTFHEHPFALAPSTTPSKTLLPFISDFVPSHSNPPGSPVVAFQWVKVGDFGGVNLPMNSSSIMQINPEIDKRFTLCRCMEAFRIQDELVELVDTAPYLAAREAAKATIAEDGYRRFQEELDIITDHVHHAYDKWIAEKSDKSFTSFI
ncbi:hypothetical protein BDN72DRAFT_897672 [Pluteus cervinus]|uniref:Uncharacterized protein n=1 Tax=Pluteus cervinus TaxID=181527 RepID=A0ACD3AUJ2_9AGAR|nr:hypothetical protein BDN72DRAFT_897672 [Pluteus cervinus]